MWTDLIQLDGDGGVATITLNRPKVNAINMEMQLSLLRAAQTCYGFTGAKESKNQGFEVDLNKSC